MVFSPGTTTLHCNWFLPVSFSLFTSAYHQTIYSVNPKVHLKHNFPKLADSSLVQNLHILQISSEATHNAWVFALTIKKSKNQPGKLESAIKQWCKWCLSSSIVKTLITIITHSNRSAWITDIRQFLQRYGMAAWVLFLAPTQSPRLLGMKGC